MDGPGPLDRHRPPRAGAPWRWTWKAFARVVALGWLAGGHALAAQELSAAAGRLHGMTAGGVTYSWHLQFIQPLNERWGVGLAWLNEGHREDHHRDGLVVQGWYHHVMRANRLRLGAGLGLLRSFDTTGEASGAYRNEHPIRPILSLKAAYPWHGGAWGTYLQVNRVLGPAGDQTQAILVGVGARYGRPASPASKPRAGAAGQELAVLFGRTILNSFSSETTRFLESLALEYRRRVGRHLAVSLAYTDEGGLPGASRDGLVAMAWLDSRSGDGAWRVALGLGPYVSRDQPSDAPGKVTVRTSGRYALSLDRHLGGHWGVRLQWNRTLTRYDRDTDALLTGLAYSW